jgi:hypothetical protein
VKDVVQLRNVFGCVIRTVPRHVVGAQRVAVV